MTKNAEITVAIQNGNPSITIYVSAQEDGETKLILRDMLSEIQEAITEFQAKPHAKLLPSAAAKVHDAPCIQPPAEEVLRETKRLLCRRGTHQSRKRILLRPAEATRMAVRKSLLDKSRQFGRIFWKGESRKALSAG